eukprot:scaffold4849_cov202-Prasinococcus_capsulatus_cf.AAC.3
MRGSRSSTPTRSLHPYSVLVQRCTCLGPEPALGTGHARAHHLSYEVLLQLLSEPTREGIQQTVRLQLHIATPAARWKSDGGQQHTHMYAGTAPIHPNQSQRDGLVAPAARWPDLIKQHNSVGPIILCQDCALLARLLHQISHVDHHLEQSTRAPHKVYLLRALDMLAFTTSRVLVTRPQISSCSSEALLLGFGSCQ